MKKVLTIAFMMCCAEMVMAQGIDFNFNNAQDAMTNEPGYFQWKVNHVASETKTLDNGLRVTIAATGNSNTLRDQWHKNTCQWGRDDGLTGNRLFGDGVVSFIADGDNTPNQTTTAMSISVTIEGLPMGHHTVAAYHIWKDPKNGEMPTVKVDALRKDSLEHEEGTEKTYTDTPVASLTGVPYVNVINTKGALKMADCSYSFIEFDIIQEGQPVTVTYTTEPDGSTTYQTTCMMLNGLLIDRDPRIATDPTPSHQDYHVDADNGSVTLSWYASTLGIKHKLVWGEDEMEVANATIYQYEGTETSHTISGLVAWKKYYWRVDEVDSEGNVFKGNVWSFKPRQLAFPEAEGYGRYAQGGRGGIVYHVTNLSGDVNTEGSLLYGLVKLDQPRYIVFDVSGIIELDFNSYFTKPYAYIAGQTAPGKGICIKASNINIGSDVIARHVRFKRGLGVYGENTGNAMGMSGANHAYSSMGNGRNCERTWCPEHLVPVLWYL